MAQEPDIDVGAITEALNNKTDTDAANFTGGGVQLVTSYGFPSTEFENLTLPASGQTYTVPADGWLCFSKKATATGQYIALIANDSTYTTEIYRDVRTSYYDTDECIVFPVSKGMIVRISYSADGTTNFFKFVYAKGSEPQS